MIPIRLERPGHPRAARALVSLTGIRFAIKQTPDTLLPRLPDQNLIERTVVAFRRACECVAQTAKTDHELGTFEKFPRGQCGLATKMLAVLLQEQARVSPDRLRLVNGCWGERSHMWLVVDWWTIDITADQFNRTRFPATVTLDTSWHRRFRGQQVHAVATINKSDLLCRVYARVQEFMPPVSTIAIGSGPTPSPSPWQQRQSLTAGYEPGCPAGRSLTPPVPDAGDRTPPSPR
jgi:hypothetical protein